VSDQGETQRVPGRNLLGLTLAFDNNIIGNRLRAVRFLTRLHNQGCIAVVVSDDVDNELAAAPDEKYMDLTEDAVTFRRNFGAMVVGYSHLGSSVLAGEDDVALMDALRAILKPGVDDWSKARPQDVRDAKHLHTAIRSGADAFVTLDENFHQKAEALSDYIPIWRPRRAATVAIKRVRNYRITGSV
jgi:hypothetical protein